MMRCTRLLHKEWLLLLIRCRRNTQVLKAGHNLRANKIFLSEKARESVIQKRKN
jgi:hypothetical protein